MNFAHLLFGLACISWLAPAAFAETGYVNLGGTQTYVDYQHAAAGQPTLVLLNGLTYSTNDWDAYVAALKQLNPGLGILRYDMIGMGNTLLKGRLPVDFEIPFTAEVELLQNLLDHYQLRRVFLAGLSYGGGIGIAFTTRHPAYVQALVLMAPYTEPLKGMDDWIKEEITATRISYPFNPYSDDELYDYYLRQFIYQFYPSLEPSTVENPYKLEGVFRMVQGIRHYDSVADAAHLPTNSVHLLQGAKDQYIEPAALDRFWQGVPQTSRMSRVVIDQSEHKIPESTPAFAAAWTLAILHGRPELSGGREFSGTASALTATSGNLVLDLHQP
jgi:pimeloyl-ACP methyl ester carboxylesterase